MEREKVGPFPHAPILHGPDWLLNDHAVKSYAGRLTCGVGVAPLDRERPDKLVTCLPQRAFQAGPPSEVTGLVRSVVSPACYSRATSSEWITALPIPASGWCLPSWRTSWGHGSFERSNAHPFFRAAAP
jgi:hypothetical protein